MESSRPRLYARIALVIGIVIVVADIVGWFVWGLSGSSVLSMITGVCLIGLGIYVLRKLKQ